MVSQGRINYLDEGGDPVAATAYYGTPNDTKPTDGVENGSCFVEFSPDVSNLYLFDEDESRWVLWNPYSNDSNANVPQSPTFVYSHGKVVTGN